jgi:hypothetical protein
LPFIFQSTFYLTVHISRFIGFQVNIPYKPPFLLAKFEDATHFSESLNIITLLLMCKVLTDKQNLSFFCRYYRGHPKVNVFFYSLIFTLNHRRPKMSKFDASDKKIIETIFFFKCHISLRFRQLGLLQS